MTRAIPSKAAFVIKLARKYHSKCNSFLLSTLISLFRQGLIIVLCVVFGIALLAAVVKLVLWQIEKKKKAFVNFDTK